jgi:twitching motility protein PilU
MEQSMAPGSQTFEQDLFRLYRENVITLDEALANADSPTNLSWLINNSQFGATSGQENPRQISNIDFDVSDESGTSFTEFSLHMDDAVAN